MKPPLPAAGIHQSHPENQKTPGSAKKPGVLFGNPLPPSAYTRIALTCECWGEREPYWDTAASLMAFILSLSFS